MKLCDGLHAYRCKDGTVRLRLRTVVGGRAQVVFLSSDRTLALLRYLNLQLHPILATQPTQGRADAQRP